MLSSHTYLLTVIALVMAVIYAINSWEFLRQKGVAWLLIATFCVEVINESLVLTGHHNLVSILIFQLVEFWIVTGIFLNIAKGQRFKYIIWLTRLFYTVLFIVDTVWIGKMTTVECPSAYVNGLVVLFLCILTFLQIFRSRSEKDIMRSPSYFFASAELFYWASTFVIFELYDFLWDATNSTIASYHHFALVVRYVLLIFALRWSQPQTSQPISSS